MAEIDGFDWSIFDNVRIQFWTCPVDHPRDPPRVTVEWDGDVATCTDCGRTNKDVCSECEWCTRTVGARCPHGLACCRNCLDCTGQRAGMTTNREGR